jgi:hypothetical protein
MRWWGWVGSRCMHVYIYAERLIPKGIIHDTARAAKELDRDYT